MQNGLENNFENLDINEAFNLLISRYGKVLEEHPGFLADFNQLNTLYRKQHEIINNDRNELTKENFELKEENDWLKRQIYGKKSERTILEDPGQLKLDLGDITLTQGEAQKQEEREEEQVTRKTTKKKKKGHGRPVLPGHLPRKKEILNPEGDLSGVKKIGEVVTEILEYEPGTLYVRQIVRPKYTRGPYNGVSIAPMPSLPVPKGNVGPGLLAHLTVSKFVDHLPFYRQGKIMNRLGVEIAESTINDWFSAGCSLLEPLYEALKKQVQNSNYLMGDETPIRVLDTSKKGETHRGYHWVYYSPLDRLVCFDYQKGRGREGPEEFLKKFKGHLQSDGYRAYDQFDESEDIRLLGCMAHARRKFFEAQNNDRERAEYALGQIGELYKIERRARKEQMSFKDRKALRQEEAKPILESMREWLIENQSRVAPKSAIGKAINYSWGLWKRLMRYTEDGRFEIDNNLVENSIRPVALGRKNYLFAGSHDGARRAAIIYSFLGTCKQNEVDPFLWMKDMFIKLPDHPVNKLEDLLPSNWNK